MDKTVGITGISGAVGGFLKPYLKSKGMRVVSLDEKTRRLDRPNFLPEDESMDWIIHIGAHTSIEESWSDPFKFYTGNSLATLAALEIAHVNKAKFIYISSYVYGVPQYTPIDEAHPVDATNPYAASKLISEHICNEIAELCELPLIIFRPFQIYGPRGKLQKL